MVGRNYNGFTLIELAVVLLVVAMLAGLVAPVVTKAVKQARESALKQDLSVIRKALDDYYADNGHYPGQLNELLQQRYVRTMPQDPITEKDDTWEFIHDANGAGIVDIKSGADGVGANGIAYREW